MDRDQRLNHKNKPAAKGMMSSLTVWKPLLIKHRPQSESWVRMLGGAQAQKTQLEHLVFLENLISGRKSGSVNISAATRFGTSDSTPWDSTPEKMNPTPRADYDIRINHLMFHTTCCWGGSTDRSRGSVAQQHPATVSMASRRAWISRSEPSSMSPKGRDLRVCAHIWCACVHACIGTICLHMHMRMAHIHIHTQI